LFLREDDSDDDVFYDAMEKRSIISEAGTTPQKAVAKTTELGFSRRTKLPFNQQ